MAITIMQGDSYPIFLNLKQNDAPLTEDYLDDLEVYVGENLRLTYAEGTVKYDKPSKRWYIWPTQEQTFNMEVGNQEVEIRVKYKTRNTINVKGHTIIDKIKVKRAKSREVL